MTSKYGIGDQLGEGASTKNGSLRRNPAKDPTVGGALVSPTAGGTINWEPPAYSPDTGLFYVSERQRLLDLLPDRSRSARLDGPRRQGRGQRRIGRQLPDGDRLQDRQDRVAASVSGRRRRRRRRSADDGRAVWSSPATPAATSSRTMRRPASRSGTRASATSPTPPQTYMLDGRQVLCWSRSRRKLYAFTVVPSQAIVSDP